jgi:hypothetical protein
MSLGEIKSKKTVDTSRLSSMFFLVPQKRGEENSEKNDNEKSNLSGLPQVVGKRNSL